MLTETLQRTLEILKEGWCQGRLWDGQESYCLAGAAYKACEIEFDRGVPIFVGRPDNAMFAYLSVCRAIEEQLPAPKLIPAFNDDPKTTHQDVLNIVEKALAEAGGMC